METGMETWRACVVVGLGGGVVLMRRGVEMSEVEGVEMGYEEVKQASR